MDQNNVESDEVNAEDVSDDHEIQLQQNETVETGNVQNGTTETDNVQNETNETSNVQNEANETGNVQNETNETGDVQNEVFTDGENESEDEENRKRSAKKMKFNNDHEDEDSACTDFDSGTNCTICYTEYTNSGDHRLTSLKCGHLFGKRCIEHWLKSACHYNARRCPACNKKAAIRDIRVIYARSVAARDTTELYNLKEKLEKVEYEKNKMEGRLVNICIQLEMQEELINKLRSQLAENNNKHKSTENLKIPEVTSIELCNAGGCRVLAYNRLHSLLVASQASFNPLFPGFGIKKINSDRMESSNYCYLYKKSIRDMTFHPYHPLLLSVSVEGCAKLFDVQNDCTTAKFVASDPLWSCCWSDYEPYKFYCGSQNGKIYKFDQREPSKGPEVTFSDPANRTGVISIHSVGPKTGRVLPHGGLVFCKLNDVYTYEVDGEVSKINNVPVHGNFTSMRFNPDTDHMLLSTRPGTRWPSTRHILSRLSATESDVCDVVHTFYGSGTPSSVLSRSAFVSDRMNNKEMIAAHNVTNNSIDVWDMHTYDKLPMNVTISDPILDICSIHQSSADLCLICLSDKKLYTIKTNL